MIFGIGTDLCAAGRMAEKLQKPVFVEHVFSPAEQALLNARGGTHRAETAAANFAAKEAFLKAAGTGLGGFALAAKQTAQIILCVLSSVLATQTAYRTPSRSEALRSATDALRRLLARRSAEAVLKP